MSFNRAQRHIQFAALLIIAFLSYANSSFSAESTVIAEGFFAYIDFNGAKIPIRNAKIKLFDYDECCG